MNRYKISWQENLVFLTDIVIIIFCYTAAFFIRFDGVLSLEYFSITLKTLPLVIVFRTAALMYFKLHKSIREYASIKDLTQIIKAVTVSSVVVVAGIMTFRLEGFPRSIFIIDWLLLVIALSGTRFIIRLSRPIRNRRENGNGRPKKVLIVGAGDAGEMILREMIYHYGHNYKVVGLVDDNPKKYRRCIHGVTVLGARVDIPDIVNKRHVQEIVITIPSLKSDEMRDIVNYCIKSGAKYRTVPDISNIMDGTVKVKELRKVKIEDLLNREEVFLDRQKIGSYIKDKCVLITGAGGSIGSEVCRQVARFSPKELVLFEKSENSLFYINMELEQFFSSLKKVPVVGDMCDRKRVKEVFLEHKPQIIFHAAAHKHVPLMETNSMEAIKNNVFGTRIIAEEAIAIGAERFIMLSTDKVVEPKSLMGVSKKIAEMYITALAGINRTKFMAVRFGNVLGSEGSVIPTFKKQIEKRGPITITHPEIKRYFMTIPEAAGLVLEAGFMGEGREIFILEMGRQIKIIDLAHDLIRLSGLEPNKDIEILFTGLRPGEKMHEALVEVDEKLKKTSHEKILVVEASRKNGRGILEDIKILEKIVNIGDMNILLKKLKQIVPMYTPSLRILGIRKEEKPQRRETKIMIVDDEKIVQEFLSKFLEGRGYNTLLASNGRDALEIIKGNDVRIAIVDIRLSGFMDGIKILKHIKKTNKNIGVIIITGFGTEKTRKLSNRLGAYAYIEKPLDLPDIKRQVEGILNAHLPAAAGMIIDKKGGELVWSR
ncbi:MAG: polysaccharide biosynthesis protein [Candidatus Omnitrophica bacterium]|nr:polysaccharide biosynthesis protein [Candidatus Omnitrophota bacterium]